MLTTHVTDDVFARLHKAFVLHLGAGVTLAWATALVAASQAPWVRNIRPLLDPAHMGRAESTASFLFAMPMILALFWVIAVAGREFMRRLTVLRDERLEFAAAGAVAFGVFYLAVDRAVAAMLLTP